MCALACHPNGQQIATADYDGTVIIRDRVSGAILSFMRDCGPIAQLHWDSNSLRVTRGNPAQPVQAIHPEGTIRAQGYDNAIRLYDRRSGRRIGRIRAHNGAITALNFLPNGLLVTAGEDERIAYWDIHTGQQISNMLYTGLMVTAAAVSHDGDTLVAALRHGPDHYGLAAISSENGELLGAPITLDSAITALSAHPLQPIVAYTKDGKVYHLCLPAGAATVSPYFSENSSGISALAYSPDGNTLAAGIHGHLVVDPPLSTRSDNQQRINDIAWHPKQPLIATSGHDSTVIIRNWSDNSVVHLSAKKIPLEAAL